MSRNFSEQSPDLISRLVCIFSYFTMGLVGLIFLLISYFLLKKNPKSFALYHIYQSFFIAVFLTILSLAFSFINPILLALPFIGRLYKSLYLFFMQPVLFGFSVIGAAITIILFYLSLGAFFGKCTYLPFVSDIVGRNVRG